MIYHLQRAWAWSLAMLVQKSEQSPILKWLLFPLHLALLVGNAIFEFSVQWLFSRDFRQLLFGIPVVVLMIPVAACLVIIPFRSNRVIAKHYLKSFSIAADKKDYETAGILNQKLSRLQDDQTDSAANMAVLAEKKGDYEEAYRHMQQLAPEETTGMPVAHFWIAEAIVTNRIQVEDPARLVKTHLDHFLKVYPKNQAALTMMSEYLMATGDEQEAIATLDKIQTRTKEQALYRDFRKALVLLRTGEARKAHQICKQTIQAYEKLSANDDLGEFGFLTWASVHKELGRHLDSLHVLDTGLLAHPDSRALQTASHETKVEIVRTDFNTAATRLRVTKQLLEADPTNEEWQMRLAAFATDASLKDQVMDLLQPSLDQDTLSINVLDRLATVAMVRDDNPEAVRLYRKLLKKRSDLYVPLNNLAWILAHSEPLDLDESIRLIEKAIALQPDDPSVRATRGHILMKKKKWKQAIADLEFGLNGMPDNRKAHRALIEAYEKTGQHQMARRHQDVLDRLPAE